MSQLFNKILKNLFKKNFCVNYLAVSNKIEIETAEKFGGLVFYSYFCTQYHIIYKKEYEENHDTRAARHRIADGSGTGRCV